MPEQVRQSDSGPWEVERDRFGVMFSGPLEVGEYIEVVLKARLDHAEEERDRYRAALIEGTPMFGNLSGAQREALERIVGDWIGEGFTTPPYKDAYYDIFEALGLAEDVPYSYDTRRPKP